MPQLRGTQMANIVYLNPVATLPRDVLPSEMSDSCEIILFPGVRYERWQEPSQPAAEERKRKTRVKKRELEPAE